MPDYEKKYVTSKPPFSAEILIRQEAHEVTLLKDNGYTTPLIRVDGGVMLKINVSADTLDALQAKIAGHVALVE